MFVGLYRGWFGRVDFGDAGLKRLRVLRRRIRRRIGDVVLDWNEVADLDGWKRRPWVLVVRMGSLDRVVGESFLRIFVERLCLLGVRGY